MQVSEVLTGNGIWSIDAELYLIEWNGYFKKLIVVMEKEWLQILVHFYVGQ